MTVKSRRPDEQDLSLPMHWSYVDRVAGQCVLGVLTEQLHWMDELGGCLSVELVDRVHAPYAWTVRQVVEHCVDAERIFGERILRIAAGDKTNLPDFDENAFAGARFGLGSIGHLIDELKHLRQSTVLLLGRIVPAAWDQVGSVDSQPITPRGVAWLTAAHVQHHFEIIQQRCGVEAQRIASE